MSTFLIIIMVLLSMVYQVLNETPIDEDVVYRSRRQLLFPDRTLLQLNAGVGTPTPIKTINVNWAFQANFVLPWNRTQIPVDILEANSGYDGVSRKRREDNDINGREYDNNARLYHFYIFVEDVVNGYGDNGRGCVLQTLCQIGAEPLHSDEEDLLHEIAGFVLNPTNDLTHGYNDDNTNLYVSAYERGQKGQGCIGQYGVCSTSLIDMFTIVLDNVDQL